MLLGWRSGVSPPPEGLENFRVYPPPAMQMIPLELDAEALEGRLTQDPRIVTTGDAWLPHPFGHVKGKGFGQKCLVHKISGPACAFIGPTRDVNPSKAQGVSAPRWRALVQCRMWDWSPQYARLFKSPAGRSRLSCWAFGKIHLPKLETALHDPEEEEEARSQLEIWLPHGTPPPLVQPTARSTPPDTRVGGPDKGNRVGPTDRQLVTPGLLLCGTRPFPGGAAGPGWARCGAEQTG